MDKASDSLTQTPLRSNGSWRPPIVDGRRSMLRVWAMAEARQIVRNCKPRTTPSVRLA
jgi:hypothetical protein